MCNKNTVASYAIVNILLACKIVFDAKSNR